MGFRTLVLLHNDRASAWENDSNLGKKIMQAAGMRKNDLGYGSVVECCHADQITMAVIDSYSFTPVSYRHWGDSAEEQTLRMLKDAAKKFGYKLVKK